MKLTENFTLEEMCATNTSYPNNPTMQNIAELEQLCINILQPLREAYGSPIRVNSGFRSKLVNEAVGGVLQSQHRFGQAADITAIVPYSAYERSAMGASEAQAEKKRLNKELFNLILTLNLPFDQLIDEQDYTWIHVSFSTRHRRQVIHRA